MFYPTVELTPDILEALGAGTLRLQRGQWVRREGAKGRLLGVADSRVNILWRYAGEAFASFVLRFKRATTMAVRISHKVAAFLGEQLELFASLLKPEATLRVMMRSASHVLLFDWVRQKKRLLTSEAAAKLPVFGYPTGYLAGLMGIKLTTDFHYRRYPSGWCY